MKFKRIYRMQIQVSETEQVVVDYPLTMTFDVNRSMLGSANKGHFLLYNLNPDTRRRIYHDRYDTITYRGIVLQAGYENESPLPTIFRGNIQVASSYRQGSNWITEIEAYDGGFGQQNGQVSQTVPAGWSLPKLISTAFKALPNVKQGAIGTFTQQNSRGVTIMGNPWDYLVRVAAGNKAVAFIDNEQANLISSNEYIVGLGGVNLITSETGILQTPRRFDGRIDVEILFEPRLIIGQLVALQSLETIYNGQYQINGLTHRGTISGAVNGTCTTVASLFIGSEKLRGITVSRAA